MEYKRNNYFTLISIAIGLLLAACGGEVKEQSRTNAANASLGGTSFMHPEDLGDSASSSLAAALRRIREEGPPDVTARFHSCRKLPYFTVGEILSALGVNMASTTNNTAGDMYRDSAAMLGAPNHSGRTGEATDPSTSSYSRLFDIFVQAAPEIITAVPTRPHCQINGQGVSLFTGDSCNSDGFTCLIGTPMTSAHLDYCNQLVTQGSTVDLGKRIAVASILAAAHTCE